ncbi:ras GEF [Lichtheimia hyalospora FSU 10163]|nr:ras GEF [Lichtheimia hyalospora FSU 10163]
MGKYWEENHTKNEQDDVFLSSTYGPLSPIHAENQGIDTAELSSAQSKDALSTTSSSYFSARSYSSDSSLRSAHCSSSHGITDSNMSKEHQVDVLEPEKERESHLPLYDSHNTSNNNESIPDKASTTSHHPLRSTLLSKAMSLGDTNTPQQQQQHGPNYHSVGTIGIGNLSSVLSKQWMLHSMRAIKPSSSNNQRAPIPSMMLQQPASTERTMAQPLSNDDISLCDNNFTYVKENGHVIMILETQSRCKSVVVAGTINKLVEKLADDSVQDFDYIDIYLLSHASFISSVDLLDRLAKHFNSNVPSCIQIKLLNVIERWVKFQYDDFKNDRLLLKKLYAFLTSSEEKHPELEKELDGIRDALSMQITRYQMCSPKMPKQQRIILRKLIQIAKLCIEWNNFHTAMNVILALQSPTIQRLHDTWAMLHSRDLTTFQSLQKYVDVSNNMGYYRQALADVQAPAVPFFPLVLKDLVFHMDGNSTLLPFDQDNDEMEPLVNFGKFRTVTRMIATLTQLTSQDYWFAADLDHCPFLPNASITRPPQCHPSTHMPPLDRVAELVEIKLRAVESCHDDPRCSILNSSTIATSPSMHK